jgi:hypothetical protein
MVMDEFDVSDLFNFNDDGVLVEQDKVDPPAVAEIIFHQLFFVQMFCLMLVVLKCFIFFGMLIC